MSDATSLPMLLDLPKSRLMEAEDVLERVFLLCDANRTNAGTSGTIKLPGQNVVAIQVVEIISEYFGRHSGPYIGGQQ